MNLNFEQNTGITLEMQNYFAGVSSKKDILSGSYLVNTSNSNFKEMLEHLFPGQEDKMILLNPGSHIGEVISDKIINYFGEAKIDGDFNIDYLELINSMLVTGNFLLGKYLNNGELQLKAIDGSKYRYDGRTEIIIELFSKDYVIPISNTLEKKYYLFVQKCAGGLITNKLYEIEKDSYIYGNEVPLNTLEETENKQEFEKIDYGTMVSSIKVEQSLVGRVQSIIYSLDRKYAEAERQYVRYTEQFKIFQNINIPDNCLTKNTVNGVTFNEINFNKLGKIVEGDSDYGVADIKIIENTNNLLLDALKFAESQIRLISAVSDIPLFFFGIHQENGNDSGTSKIKSSGGFYKRIEKYRTKFTVLLEIIFKSFNKEYGVSYDNIIKMDEEEIVDIESKKLKNGLTSKVLAIMKVHKVDEDRAREILQSIIEENKLFNNVLENDNSTKVETKVSK